MPVLTVLISGLGFAQDEKPVAPEQKAVIPIDCTGTARACSKPAKFLTKTLGCICFTCGYGTPQSRQICTKNPSEAKALADLVQSSGFPDENMDAVVGQVSAEKVASGVMTTGNKAKAEAPSNSKRNAKPAKTQ